LIYISKLLILQNKKEFTAIICMPTEIDQTAF
jgi:hypothetical protein